jgi:iron complex transport system substrate-binding protein
MIGRVKNLHLVTSAVAMCLFLLLATVVFSSAAFGADKRRVVDSAGRRVEVPAKIERVFAAGVPAGVFLNTLAPKNS